jgi:hypothetical protein
VQAIGDRQSGGIVCAGVDAGTRGQGIQGLLQTCLRDGQLVLRSQGWNVIQDANCHGTAPLSSRSTWFEPGSSFAPAAAPPGNFAGGTDFIHTVYRRRWTVL